MLPRQWSIREVIAHSWIEDRAKISERTFPNFLGCNRDMGVLYFQACKIMLMYLYTKVELAYRVCFLSGLPGKADINHASVKKCISSSCLPKSFPHCTLSKRYTSAMYTPDIQYIAKNMDDYQQSYFFGAIFCSPDLLICPIYSGSVQLIHC